MAKQKHNPKSRHHKRIVGGILATALALMVVVAAQIGNTDTDLFKAQTGGTMTEAEMQAGCVAGGGTWMGINAMPSCNMPTGGGTANQCPSGQYWNGNMCTSSTATTTTCSSDQYWNGTACVSNTNTATTCSGGQYWNGTACVGSTTGTACPTGQWWDSYTNSCKSTSTTDTAHTCPAGQWWDYATNICKSSTTSGTAATSCGSGMWWDSYTNSCKSSTATGGYVADTISACQGRGGVWTAGTSTCSIAPGSSTYSGGYSGGTYSGMTGGAGQYVTEPTCTAKAYFWGTKTNWCYNTQIERSNGENMSTTYTSGTVYNDPNAAKNCADSYGFWVAPTAAGAQGWCKYDNNSANTGMTNGASQYITQPTCTANGYFWGAKTNWCYNTQVELQMGEKNAMNTTYTQPGNQWKNPASFGGDSEGCTNAGFYYDETQQDCFPSGGGMYPPMPTTAVNCGPGSYYDFGKQACMQMQKPAFNDFQYNEMACMPGDTMCGQFDQSMFNKGQFDSQQFFDLDQVQCMNPRDAKRTLGMRKKELKDIDKELKSMDLSTLNQSPTIAAAISSIEDAKGIAQEMEANPSSTDYGCLAGKLDRIVGQLHSPEVGFWDAINQLRQVSEFKAQLGKVRWEFDEVSQRLGYMDIGEEDAATVTEIINAGLARVDELEANPPVDDWGNVDWDSMEPECMRFQGPMPMGPSYDGGGGYGGPMPGPYRPCSAEELEASNTPRGYIELARMWMDEAQQGQFQDNMCQDAGTKIAEFEQMLADNSDQLDKRGIAEANRWVADADKALSRCDSAQDKRQVMPMFEGLKMRAEKLASLLGFADQFKVNSAEFTGTKYLMSQNVLTDIDSLQDFISQKINEEVNKRMAEVYDKVRNVLSETVNVLAKAGISDEILSGLTDIMNTLVDTGNEAVMSGLSQNMEIAAALTSSADESRSEAVQAQQEVLVEGMNDLNTLEAVAPEAQEAVNTARELMSDRPYTPERLEQAQTAIEAAVNLAKNGGDAEEVATAVEEGVREALVASTDPVENENILNRELVDNSLLEHTDINPREWYGPPATEAGVLCDLGTVTDDGTKVARPTVGLNVAEGWATASKCSGIEPNSNVTPEVRAIIGNVTWAGEYFQGMVDAGVPVAVLGEKVRSAGGIAGSMERGEAVDSLMTIMEARGVDLPEIDPATEIGHYEDYDRLSEAQREDLARAHYYGVSTGAAGGTRADANAPIDRAQMFTMAVRDYHALEAEGVSFPTPPTALEGSSSRNLPDPTGGRVDEEIPSI